MPRANRNHGLRDLHHVVLCLATATDAWSCGTTDRTENEKKYLELALEIREKIQNDEECFVALFSVEERTRQGQREKEGNCAVMRDGEADGAAQESQESNSGSK